jgi:hypothetical protein
MELPAYDAGFSFRGQAETLVEAYSAANPIYR